MKPKTEMLKRYLRDIRFTVEQYESRITRLIRRAESIQRTLRSRSALKNAD
jgi:hypothetical protein